MQSHLSLNTHPVTSERWLQTAAPFHFPLGGEVTQLSGGQSALRLPNWLSVWVPSQFPQDRGGYPSLRPDSTPSLSHMELSDECPRLSPSSFEHHYSVCFYAIPCLLLFFFFFLPTPFMLNALEVILKLFFQLKHSSQENQPLPPFYISHSFSSFSAPCSSLAKSSMVPSSSVRYQPVNWPIQHHLWQASVVVLILFRKSFIIIF